MDGFFQPERIVAADLEQDLLNYLWQLIPRQDGWWAALAAWDKATGLSEFPPED